MALLCPHPGMILWQRVTFGHSEVDRWKTVHPSAKVTQERTICGMSTRGWKEGMRRRTFPVTHRLITKRGFFGKFDLLMETFLEYETMCREPPPGHVFWEVWRKSIQGKWQKWCVVHVTKNNASATHFFALYTKPSLRNSAT